MVAEGQRTKPGATTRRTQGYADTTDTQQRPGAGAGLDPRCGSGGPATARAGRADALRAPSRRGDARRAPGDRRHGRRGGADHRGDRAGGRGRGYRLRHERGTHLAARRRPAGQPAARAQPHRGGGAGRFRHAHERPGAAFEYLAAGARIAGHPGTASRHRQDAEAPRWRDLDPPAGQPGWWQPFHRAVPGRGRCGVDHAAFRFARDRQRDRPLLH